MAHFQVSLEGGTPKGQDATRTMVTDSPNKSVHSDPTTLTTVFFLTLGRHE